MMATYTSVRCFGGPFDGTELDAANHTAHFLSIPWPGHGYAIYERLGDIALYMCEHA